MLRYLKALAIVTLLGVTAISARSAAGTSVLNRCRIVRVDGEYFVMVFSGALAKEGLRPKPAPVAGLQIWRTGEDRHLIWSIEAEDLSMVDVVRYAVVPAGYRQDYPAQGTPEPLTNGSYELRCGGPGLFEIQGNRVTNLD